MSEPRGEGVAAKASSGPTRPTVIRTYPPWMLVANGRVYRPLMRAMHRFGWCYPSLSLIEPGHVWCHWCGMRGRRPTIPSGVPGAEALG